MKLINLVLVIVLVVLLVKLSSTKKVSDSVKVEDVMKKGVKVTKSPQGEVISVSEEDVMIENRGIPVKQMGNFPIPQSTTITKSLSPEMPEDLSVIVRGAVLDTPPVVIESRDTGLKENEKYFPKYYRKDNLSGNTRNTGEYRFAETDNLKSSYSWSDKNVSQYPTYYTSDFKDNLTNVGAFFDHTNQYVDTTSPRSQANVDDVCYVSREGEKVCLDNKHLQNIPPSLITDKSRCGFLNSIGRLQYTNMVDESVERVNNGGILYDNVRGSRKNNETYSKPLKGEILGCQL